MRDGQFTKSSTARIFHYAYEHRRVSKQHIARDLELSLPTVAKAVSLLTKEGLMTRDGTFPSAGGRPAAAYKFCADARFAIGIEIVAQKVNVAFLDLYGGVLGRHTHHISYEHTDAYRQGLADALENDMSALGMPRERLLGGTIAIQGIVSKDEHVTFGGLLGADSANVSLEDFAHLVSFPLRLVHDAEAAAYAEAWRHGGLRAFAYLSLNDHLGSALVRDGQLVRSSDFGAGVAEHMTILPHGTQCYCGNHGCFETVLGAKALERQARMPLPQFFEALRTGDKGIARLWSTYLEYLALLIHNLRMTACGDVVIGGRIARYLTQKDLRVIRLKCISMGSLSTYPFHLARGHYEDLATVIGAGLLTVNEFLSRAIS